MHKSPILLSESNTDLQVFLFDLDDTLYPERQFVESGFRAVSHQLGVRYGLDEEGLFLKLLTILKEQGSGRTFDNPPEDLGMYSEERVMSLVYLYRLHQPELHPYEGFRPTLDELKRRGVKPGIVTDGMPSVQRNKLASLRLTSVFDIVVCSDDLDRRYRKPSVVPYAVALEMLGGSPTHAAYIGNDVSKDFAAPNSMGMLTIMVNRDQVQRSGLSSEPSENRQKLVIERPGEILSLVREDQRGRS